MERHVAESAGHIPCHHDGSARLSVFRCNSPPRVCFGTIVFHGHVHFHGATVQIDALPGVGCIIDDARALCDGAALFFGSAIRAYPKPTIGHQHGQQIPVQNQIFARLGALGNVWEHDFPRFRPTIMVAWWRGLNWQRGWKFGNRTLLDHFDPSCLV